MLVLYDDALARTFEPFAFTRPLGEVRAGALLVRERWARVSKTGGAELAGAPWLRGFAEFDAPASVTHPLAAGTIVVNTRALPLVAQSLDAADLCWTIDGQIAAVRLAAALDADELADGSLTLDALAARQRTDSQPRALEGVWMEAVWDLIRHLSSLLASDIPALADAFDCVSLGSSALEHAPLVMGDHKVWLEAGASIEPFTVFDTTAGPVLLRRGSTVQAFSRIIGPCYIGCDSTVTTDRIAGSSIGDVCRVHGELSASILIGHANKGHDGFVGHSVLGRWVNLGAGTITSNLKNTYGTVALWTPTGIRDSGLQFLGTMFGDHAKTGIGLRLTTGCVLGAGSNVMDAMPPKHVAPFSWGIHAPYAAFEFDKFVETATRMMARRQVLLDTPQVRFWKSLHTAAADDSGHGTR